MEELGELVESDRRLTKANGRLESRDSTKRPVPSLSRRPRGWVEIAWDAKQAVDQAYDHTDPELA